MKKVNLKSRIKKAYKQHGFDPLPSKGQNFTINNTAIRTYQDVSSYTNGWVLSINGIPKEYGSRKQILRKVLEYVDRLK